MASPRLLLVSMGLHVGAIVGTLGHLAGPLRRLPPPRVCVELSTSTAASAEPLPPLPPIDIEPVTTTPIVSDDPEDLKATNELADIDFREVPIDIADRLLAVARQSVAPRRRVSPPPPAPLLSTTPPAPTLDLGAIPVVPHARVVAPEPGQSPAPDYPALARRRGWQGTVVLRLTCDADGNVVAVVVVASSGHSSLDAAAIAAAQRWRLTGGPGSCEQPFEFRLR